MLISKITTPSGYYTPSKLSLGNLGLNLCDESNAGKVIFGTQGTQIDFAGAPPAVSNTLDANTYTCFFFDSYSYWGTLPVSLLSPTPA